MMEGTMSDTIWMLNTEHLEYVGEPNPWPRHLFSEEQNELYRQLGVADPYLYDTVFHANYVWPSPFGMASVLMSYQKFREFMDDPASVLALARELNR